MFWFTHLILFILLFYFGFKLNLITLNRQAFPSWIIMGTRWSERWGMSIRTCPLIPPALTNQVCTGEARGRDVRERCAVEACRSSRMVCVWQWVSTVLVLTWMAGNYWQHETHKRSLLDSFASCHGFSPSISSNWANIPKAALIKFKVCATPLFTLLLPCASPSSSSLPLVTLLIITTGGEISVAATQWIDLANSQHYLSGCNFW